MLNKSFLLIKKYRKISIILGLNYATIIVFPVYGPVLLKMISGQQIIFMSCWTLLFLIIGFIFMPGSLAKQESHKRNILMLGVLTALLVVIFSKLPIYLQWFTLALMGFTSGRLLVYWTKILFAETLLENRTRVISLGLFVASTSLYFSNIIVPSLSKEIATIIPAALILSANVFYYKYEHNKESFTATITSKNSPVLPIPWILFLIILCIYIPAGITYADVYPYLTIYNPLERYYNVLPFVITVFFTGYIGDYYGRKYLLYLGLAFTGASFTFLTLNPGIFTYFLVQTTLQAAWAFLDVYAWVFLADIAEMRNRKLYYPLGLGFVMGGVIVGSLLSYLIRNNFPVFNPTLYHVFAHLPLFIAVAYLGRIPETYRSNPRSTAFNSDLASSNLIISLDSKQKELNDILTKNYTLTPREIEIVNFIISGYSNAQISEALFISTNTVKYHIKNILRKMGERNRNDIRQKIIDYII
ncbi:MAG: hypothetical protein JM58_19365 [Peptococcaceae bacterium BICA1-8]|nr:MAG: hypothetical protein JM58_19365 [Peptococcaceae bacterium BICA1-8]